MWHGPRTDSTARVSFDPTKTINLRTGQYANSAYLTTNFRTSGIIHTSRVGTGTGAALTCSRMTVVQYMTNSKYLIFNVDKVL